MGSVEKRTNLDIIGDVFGSLAIGVTRSREDLIRMVTARSCINPGSIIPSDYCYNRVNRDKLHNRRLLNFNLFEYLGDSSYRYLGPNAPYSGKMWHSVRLGEAEKCVGFWEKGVRTLSGINDASCPVVSFSSFQESVKSTCSHHYIPSPRPSSVDALQDIAIAALWNSDSQSEWSKALKMYWNTVNLKHLEVEKEIDCLEVKYVEEMDAKHFFEFLYEVYFYWKFTASNRIVTTRNQLERYFSEGKMEELADIHARIFSADRKDIRYCLSIAKEIHGLGTAGASGLLAVLFPDYFGTVDQFAVKTLLNVDLPERQQLLRMKPESLTLNDGVVLIEIYRKKSEILNRKWKTDFWTPRKIDMVLWSVGRSVE